MGAQMKRFVIGTSALFAAMALAPPAQASVIPQYTVSGSYSGTAALDNGGGCSFIHQTVSVTGNITPFGPTTSLALAYCVEFGSPYNVDGSYALATPDGTVGGAVTGQVDATPNTDGVFPYHFDLTVDAATGKFAGATARWRSTASSAFSATQPRERPRAPSASALRSRLRGKTARTTGGAR